MILWEFHIMHPITIPYQFSHDHTPIVTPPKGIKNKKKKKVHFVLPICSVEHGQIK